MINQGRSPVTDNVAVPLHIVPVAPLRYVVGVSSYGVQVPFDSVVPPLNLVSLVPDVIVLVSVG